MAQWDVATGSLGAKLRLIVTEVLDGSGNVVQDIAANTSQVLVQLRAINVPSATHTDQGSARIAGAGSTATAAIDWPSGTSEKTLLSITRTIEHDADGTKTLSITGSIVGSTGTSGLGGLTTNGPRSFPLTPIPRGPRVKSGGAYKPSVLFVKSAGVYKPAIPFVKSGGTYKPVGG